MHSKSEEVGAWLTADEDLWFRHDGGQLRRTKMEDGKNESKEGEKKAAGRVELFEAVGGY